MAELAVSLVIDQLLPLLREEASLLKGIHKKFADIKDELESIQAFLKDADKRASRERVNNDEGVKIWVKQVIEAAFRIEDIVDEYMIYVAKHPRQPGFQASLHRIGHFIKSLKHRHRIASEIEDIMSSVLKIKERKERYGFQIQPYGGQQNGKWHELRMDSLYMEDAEVVGFEAPKNRLIGWLVKGKLECSVIFVVGMGGQGKTTLAKKVFDSKEVVGHFDCRIWITVSESYSVEGLMREMLTKFYKQIGGTPPQDIVQMDRGSLIDEVRNYLQRKRYVVVFDDVWNIYFWDEIKFAFIDNYNGSKIIITTRNIDVVVSCKKSSIVEVHELQSLTDQQSWELFNKKAFRFDYGGCCPKELIDISKEILKKCKGLPLAIVVIGALLSTKEKNVFEWKRFSENLISELNKDSHLIGIKEILGFSYDDLPYYLKPCLLYFGIYPEDYEVKPKRLTWQWIAEGFVKEEKGKTLEEVAEGYLIELIRRSLVQVSSTRIDGKVKACRVHDLVRLMILEKFVDLSFCKHIGEDHQSSLGGRIRRLSIDNNTSEDLAMCIESSHVKSLLLYNDVKSLLHMPDGFVSRILTKYKSLKVVDFEYLPYFLFPKNLGNLIHLKYLRIHAVDKFYFPESIGLLQNLETLDLRGVHHFEVPKDFNKLRKLRHLHGNKIYFSELKDGIGGLTSLQTLSYVGLWENGAIEIIRELGKLKELRELGIFRVSKEYGCSLSSSICEMQNLEKLKIKQYKGDDIIDLNLVSPPSMLQNITLNGELERFPMWILKLQNLIKLKLEYSHLIDDPMKTLKNMPNLLILHLLGHSYKGESLHFEDGGFQKLKELKLVDLDKLNCIIIDKGSLLSLEKLVLWKIPLLNRVPSGMEHLQKLQSLIVGFMPISFLNRLARKDSWVRKHVPHLEVLHENTLLGWRKKDL